MVVPVRPPPWVCAPTQATASAASTVWPNAARKGGDRPGIGDGDRPDIRHGINAESHRRVEDAGGLVVRDRWRWDGGSRRPRPRLGVHTEDVAAVVVIDRGRTCAGVVADKYGRCHGVLRGQDADEERRASAVPSSSVLRSAKTRRGRTDRQRGAGGRARRPRFTPWRHGKRGCRERRRSPKVRIPVSAGNRTAILAKIARTAVAGVPQSRPLTAVASPPHRPFTSFTVSGTIPPCRNGGNRSRCRASGTSMASRCKAARTGR